MEINIPTEAIAMIGVEKQVEYEVTKKDIKRFAQAIGDHNPLYYDEDYARTTKYKTIVAPPLFCHMFAFEDVPVEDLQSDGSPKEVDVPLPAKRMMGGASVFENHVRIKPGDKILVKAKIKDIYAKSGKSGELYFIVLETCFYNQANELAAKETATFVKRI